MSFTFRSFLSLDSTSCVTMRCVLRFTPFTESINSTFGHCSAHNTLPKRHRLRSRRSGRNAWVDSTKLQRREATACSAKKSPAWKLSRSSARTVLVRFTLLTDRVASSLAQHQWNFQDDDSGGGATTATEFPLTLATNEEVLDVVRGGGGARTWLKRRSDADW